MNIVLEWDKHKSMTESLDIKRAKPILKSIFMKTQSMWGKEDKDTVNAIKSMSFTGKWLDLAAGDGRYVGRLINKADKLMLADLDKNVIEKLVKKIPTKNRKKVEIRTFDMTKRFPFENETFDGVFCTGTLHLFTQKILQKIITEIKRVLKPQGRIFFDFATDIKREMKGGALYRKPNEPSYNSDKAETVLKSLAQTFNVKTIKSRIKPQKINEAHKTYTITCNFIIITGKKEPRVTGLNF